VKIMILWEIHPDKRHDVLAGFASMDLADYQSQQGPNIRVLGRWHDLSSGRGVGVVETDDPGALSTWLMSWNPAVDFEVAIVHDDAEAHALAKARIEALGG
jgi:hypothetical protein